MFFPDYAMCVSLLLYSSHSVAGAPAPESVTREGCGAVWGKVEAAVVASRERLNVLFAAPELPGATARPRERRNRQEPNRV